MPKNGEVANRGMDIRASREEHWMVYLEEDAATNKDLINLAEKSQPFDIPILEIKLFGGMEISQGNRVISLNEFKRKKAITLLALLVLNKGNLVSRTKIAETLWPSGGLDAFKRNFYSVWSQLKSVLACNGACPYVIKCASGCRIDPAYVKSDIGDLSDICRLLMFGCSTWHEWERVYEKVNSNFGSELLPHEENLHFVESARVNYKMQLVDALITASIRLNESGEPHRALWFAREALAHDDLREDVYIALLEAQIAANQRSAAVETYFMCRRALVDKLGLDPSVKVVNLYNSIIESVESIA